REWPAPTRSPADRSTTGSPAAAAPIRSTPARARTRSTPDPAATSSTPDRGATASTPATGPATASGAAAGRTASGQPGRTASTRASASGGDLPPLLLLDRGLDRGEGGGVDTGEARLRQRRASEPAQLRTPREHDRSAREHHEPVDEHSAARAEQRRE